MAPEITDGTELRIRVGNQTLRIRELTPRSPSDFVTTTSGGLRQDQGVLSKNSSAGIAEDAFYTGKSRVTSVAPGANLFIQSSADKPVVVVQLEDN